MRKPYCCEGSKALFEEYYTGQSGGMPVYQGSLGQKGHGLGSMISGWFRNALPLIKRGLAFFGKQALKTGLEVANDVAEGGTFADSARRRLPDGINRFVSTVGPTLQSGSGRTGRTGQKRRKHTRSSSSRRRPKSNKKKIKKRSSISSRRRDIFS